MKPYTLGIYEKAMPAELSWKEKMETAKAAGYDFIEISSDETEEKLKRLDMAVGLLLFCRREGLLHGLCYQ